MRNGLGVAGLLLVAACNCGDPPAALGPADGGVVVQAILPCTQNSDCAFGQVCLAGQCLEATAQILDAGLCQSDQDCPDLRFVCAVSTGQCVRIPSRCLSDSDCPSDARCDLSTAICRTALDAGTEPPCLEGEVRSCGPSKVGECRFGTERCRAGAWGPCVGAVVPGPESCDGRDDDCDGLVDEDFDLQSDLAHCGQCGHACAFDHAAASCQSGLCHLGSCEPGWWNANGDPTDGCEYRCDLANGGVEVCDGLDDDCDGRTDEGFDQDGDGFTVCAGDCDDAQAQVHPGALEVCNARDDDCDGLVDEGFDQDGDTFTTCEGDCDDADPVVHPGALEHCDGRDQDCDGQVDEWLGSTACGVGACLRVTENCIGGVPQTCQPGTPTAEACNGLDDDCDGSTDEDLGSTSCGAGACRRTTENCVAGAAQTCRPAAPGVETCNGLDDDCDGQADEGLGSTTCGAGACQRTIDNCIGGVPQTCQPGTASVDLCNGLDDDCDGQTDEGLGITTCGDGACQRTVENCVGGVLQICQPGAAVAELCNGLDDDCDGAIDEDLGSTSCGVGACRRTTENCIAGASQVCRPAAPGVESCNGVDDDCDGQTDEGLGSTTCGAGACQRTAANCIGGVPQTCQPGTPGGELCNGLDDDCDGQADDGLGSTTCGAGACRRTVENCLGGVLQVCQPGTPGVELCNGLDDDCDGQTDEGLGSTSCGVGACRRTVANCAGGAAQTCLPAAPGVELCNAVDDDCDGLTDEHVTRFVQDGGQQSVRPVYRPVDIIFVVANNGTMNEEILAVEANINESFAAFVESQGLDYRVIMLSQYGYGGSTGNYALCVRPPLGGNASCTGTCPVNTSRFFHYSVGVGAHDSLYQIVATYRAPDACGLAPSGWSQWLRPGAAKVFIEISDNGPNAGSPEQQNAFTAETFERQLFALSPQVFGTAQARAYSFHSIAGLLENNPVLSPWLATDPLVDARCTGNGGYVQQPGLEYQKLSQRTGALRYPICQYQSFDAVFQGVAQSILEGNELSCEFQVSSVPADSSLDNTLLDLVGSDGSAVSLGHVADAASCSGDSFYVEGGVFRLCPQACARWRADPAAQVEVAFTCERQVP